MNSLTEAQARKLRLLRRHASAVARYLERADATPVPLLKISGTHAARQHVAKVIALVDELFQLELL